MRDRVYSGSSGPKITWRGGGGGRQGGRRRPAQAPGHAHQQQPGPVPVLAAAGAAVPAGGGGQEQTHGGQSKVPLIARSNIDEVIVEECQVLREAIKDAPSWSGIEVKVHWRIQNSLDHLPVKFSRAIP